MITTVVAVVGGGLVLLALFNYNSFKKLFRAGRAQAGKVGRFAEQADPMALLQQSVDDGVVDIEQAKKGLENAGALVKSLERQVKGGQNEKTRLETRIQAVMDNGDPNNTAENYALQLAGVEKQLAENQEQLTRQKTTYESFAKRIKLGQERVNEARKKCAELGIKLVQSERERALGEFARDFKYDPNAFNTDFGRAEELVNQKIDENRAAVDVSLEFSGESTGQAADDELEKKAEASKILERFKNNQPVG